MGVRERVGETAAETKTERRRVCEDWGTVERNRKLKDVREVDWPA